jgi:thioredoxin reductase (NADPH)
MSTSEAHARISVLLTPQEIERIRHFGKVRSFRAGEALFNVGDMGHGLCVILTGNVELSRVFESGARKTFPIQGPGEVLGEMAQLAGQATLVNGRALEPVEALLIPPDEVRGFWWPRPNSATES